MPGTISATREENSMRIISLFTLAGAAIIIGGIILINLGLI